LPSSVNLWVHINQQALPGSEGNLLIVSGGPHDILLSVKYFKDLVTSTELSAQFSTDSCGGRRQRSAGRLAPIARSLCHTEPWTG